MSESMPRIRWAGIVFGALFAAVAAAGLVVTLDAHLLLAVQEWWVPIGLSIGPFALPFVLVVGLGVVILVIAGIALIRRRRRVDPGAEISRPREPNV